MDNADDSLYVEVIIDRPAPEFDSPFHYRVPEELRDRVEIGSLLLVPLAGRPTVAYAVGFTGRPSVQELKPVSAVLDEDPVFDISGQRLCRWISDRYLCPLSQAFGLVLPPGRGRKVRQFVSLKVSREEALLSLMRTHRRQLSVDVVEALAACPGPLEMSRLAEHLGDRRVSRVVSTLEELGLVSRRFVISEPHATAKKRLVVRLRDRHDVPTDRLPARQRDIFEQLVSSGGAEYRVELLKRAGAGDSSLRSLVKKGVVEIAGEEVQRHPGIGSGSSGPIPPPNRHQAAAIDAVVSSLESGRTEVFLLEGVTGSGKTEVYLRSIEKVLELGRTAIVLVPEISLTPQTLERFGSRFPGAVAVLHSRLGSGERYDQWRGIREGRYRVVVGARSALFAPIRDLGLIAIDEEHESSYKSETAPRYHARDVAEFRARMSGAVLVLGSATPSLESTQRSRAGLYRHLRLPSRVDNRPMPEIEIVDMRTVGGAGTIPLVSTVLLDALSRTVSAGEQAILFLNRRGFANYMQCHNCGHIPGCGECEVSLCYHMTGDMLMCHHCGNKMRVPRKCPECAAAGLKRFGAGTQRVEEEVEKHLPGVPLMRMDADTTRKKDSHRRIIEGFRRGEAPVLIGTQMIAKGLDIPGVTLVGVINADTALALPDFRAAERTYQLLTQVSGRAGRGLKPGRVVVQTFNPDHPAIIALTGDVGRFLETELTIRKNALYPPFAELINLLVTSTDLRAAARSAGRLRKILESDLAGAGVSILGPAPSPLTRLRGRYRWHILLKCGSADDIGSGVKASISRFKEYSKAFPAEGEVSVSVDIDPVSLL